MLNVLPSVFVFLFGVMSFADSKVIELKIKDHKFSIESIEVVENLVFEILVINEGPGPEEFESHELKIEKVIMPGKSAKLKIGPLKKGRYPFVGEFNPETAKGVIIVK